MVQIDNSLARERLGRELLEVRLTLLGEFCVRLLGASLLRSSTWATSEPTTFLRSLTASLSESHRQGEHKNVSSQQHIAWKRFLDRPAHLLCIQDLQAPSHNIAS